MRSPLQHTLPYILPLPPLILGTCSAGAIPSSLGSASSCTYTEWGLESPSLVFIFLLATLGVLECSNETHPRLCLVQLNPTMSHNKGLALIVLVQCHRQVQLASEIHVNIFPADVRLARCVVCLRVLVSTC